MKKNNKKGFTLVELVIVVAVMAVLVAVAIPTIASITGEAKDAVGKSNAKTIESIIKLEEANVDGKTPATKDIAIAVYEAKLGIKDEDTTDSTVPTYYYNPVTGTVLHELSESDDEDAFCSIEFNEDGEIEIGAMPVASGEPTDKGGTYAVGDDDKMAWTPVT